MPLSVASLQVKDILSLCIAYIFNFLPKFFIFFICLYVLIVFRTFICMWFIPTWSVYYGSWWYRCTCCILFWFYFFTIWLSHVNFCVDVLVGSVLAYFFVGVSSIVVGVLLRKVGGNEIVANVCFLNCWEKNCVSVCNVVWNNPHLTNYGPTCCRCVGVVTELHFSVTNIIGSYVFVGCCNDRVSSFTCFTVPYNFSLYEIWAT